VGGEPQSNRKRGPSLQIERERRKDTLILCFAEKKTRDLPQEVGPNLLRDAAGKKESDAAKNRERSRSIVFTGAL